MRLRSSVDHMTLTDMLTQATVGSVTGRLHITVPSGTRKVDCEDPSYAGTYRPFGTHHDAGMEDQAATVTFRVGLTDSLQRLTAAKRLAPATKSM